MAPAPRRAPEAALMLAAALVELDDAPEADLLADEPVSLEVLDPVAEASDDASLPLALAVLVAAT